jgi:hypothetical protein
MAERPSELLPCPCCGSPARLSKEYEDCDGNAAVECSACNLLSWPARDWNARTLDAAPSEPSAEHWRRAVEQWKAKHGWYVGDRLQAVCEVEALASELAKESRRDG